VINIVNSEGEIHGILVVNIDITWLENYVGSLRLAPGGYGILVSQNMVVLTHPHRAYMGLQLHTLSGGGDYEILSRTLRTGGEVSARTITDTDGGRMIVFFRKLFNGWYVGIITPHGRFYQDLFRAIAILSVMGFLLAVFLSIVLLRLSAAQMKSDEENKAKSSFLARMSHEIRTPMNAIIGMSEIALRQNIAAETRTCIGGIRQAGENLLSIINDILDFSKIESGHLDIVEREYALSSLLGDCASIVRGQLEEKALSFETDFARGLPNKLLGDEARLRQITLNLLSNAVKYTRQGSVTLSVDAEKIDEAGSRVNLCIKVADTGIGIKSGDMSKLFGEFTRFDAQKNRAVEGSGLGLVITRSLCHLMGGDISVQSEYGRGSIFTAVIPQTVMDSSPFTLAEEKKLSGVFAVRWTAPDARILVVDDLDTNLTVARGLLAPYQMEIHTALSGKEALELVHALRYDVVLMDHMMPEMDGIETTARIRDWEKEAASKKSVIIALTANAISGMKEMFIEKGFNDYLSKPIEIAKLDEILFKWIPLEKQRKLGAGGKPALQNANSLLEIYGVDAASGIAATGGSVDGYKRVLAVFKKDAEDRLALLQEPPAPADLPSFITQAHALKSASASIGAAELASRAAALESAGKAGDMDAVNAGLPAFYALLKATAQSIQAALGDGKQAPEAKPAAAPRGTVVRLFRDLLAALEAQKIAAIDSLLIELEKTPVDSEIKSGIVAVSDAVLVMDFEQARTIVRGILAQEKGV
jgi:signal transduction histidine kinase/CheY-like chemotaxis protein